MSHEFYFYDCEECKFYAPGTEGFCDGQLGGCKWFKPKKRSRVEYILKMFKKIR